MSYMDGMTGRLFEEATLGRCGATFGGYLTWHDALELVRKCQPCNKRPAAQRLENELVRQFGKFGFGTSVRFYTAVRSPLDRWHGVDSFVECGRFIVTIDVTINPHKDGGKADLILHPEDFDDLPALVLRIARVLASKVRRGR